MTARTDRILALVAGGVLSLFFTGWAAFHVAGWAVGSVERTSHQVIPGPVRELKIDAGGGDVTLVPSGGSEITLDSETEGSLHTPRLRVHADGDVVSVDGGCPEFSFGHCRATLVVHLPPDTAVRVDASNGDVEASGLTGNADLSTASGDVRVRDLGGRVSLESSSGDVDATELRAPTVRAHSSSGDVMLVFASAPNTAEADTASGDVQIRVPHGGEAYRVEVETESGDQHVGVSEDPSSARLLRATTSSGDASVEYRG